jgi:hypothetical protein
MQGANLLVKLTPFVHFPLHLRDDFHANFLTKNVSTVYIKMLVKLTEVLQVNAQGRLLNKF